MDALQKISESCMKNELPSFEVGDTVRVQVKIKEGDKERLQALDVYKRQALCLAAAGVFFASVRLGGENEDAARNAARMLCREEQEILFDTEKLGQLWQQFCGFWQGGAGHILEEIRDFVAKQIVSPEQLPEPVVGKMCIRDRGKAARTGVPCAAAMSTPL